MVDVLAYVLARLLLVVVLTALIFGAGHLLGVRDFPLVVALLFAMVIALAAGHLDLRPAATSRHGEHRRFRRTPPQGPRAVAGQTAR